MAQQFPGRLVAMGEQDSELVRSIQVALAALGYGPFEAGVFDSAMRSAVRLFQTQHSDLDGQALLVDGKVGRLTWGALFGPIAVEPHAPPSGLMLTALRIAQGQVGQMEQPLGSNRGPMVDEYLRAVDIDPTQGTPDDRPWCMAFMYWAFRAAAVEIGATNPLPLTAGCLEHWRKSRTIPGVRRITAAEASQQPELIKPGLIFILDMGNDKGHTGIVTDLLPSGRLATVEGNTDPNGSRTGVGVFGLDRRKLSAAELKGFVDYSMA